MNEVDLKTQVILSKNIPNNVKKLCLDRLGELDNSVGEVYKIRMYINILISFPWTSIMSDNIFARNHALLKNYLVKNWEQKELPRFLNNLLNNKGIEAVKKYFNKIVRLYDHQRVFDLVKQ